MASIAKTLAVLVLGLGLRVSATGSRGGSLDFFSDDKCQHRIQAETAPISLDVCMPASPLGELSRSFRVDQKPYCPDGSRPSLLFFQDCACTDGIANYIPNANYGDYGNGSCQAMWGDASATTPSASASDGSDTASATASGGSQATPTLDSSSSSSSSQQGGGNDSSPSSSTGTRTRVVQLTGTNSQAAATTTSAAMGRYYEMGTMYWVGYAGIFGVVSFLTL
ncbi:hypothetical protein TrVFT333_002011 [Trichoderma virens FT-333]|nr:hypothetical protein TrVFT333_002011 [Trichoderma virens FT-333]